ncbi:hypothetical protein NPIL_580951, partial [Nephila pilipes]
FEQELDGYYQLCEPLTDHDNDQFQREQERIEKSEQQAKMTVSEKSKLHNYKKVHYAFSFD